MSFTPYGFATPGGPAGGGLAGTYPNPTIGSPLSFPGHLVSTAAGVPASSNLGANVTSVTPAGNDVAGTLTIVMSGALAANTRVATITWAATYGVTPKVTLVDQTSAAGIGLVNFYVLANAAGSFDLASDQALAAGTYIVDYITIG